MHEHAVELNALAWGQAGSSPYSSCSSWAHGCRWRPGLGAIASRLYAVGCIAAGLGVWVLANVALHLNDTHIDLTREKVYTPSATAMAVVDELRTPVNITYFYRSEDPIGQRARNILEVMGRRNPMLTVLTVDPDKQPELARREGVQLYNAAIVEAAGRRVLIQGTDEAEIAIGIQRVLRTRALTVCFLEGHGEFAMDGFEFHTHLEGISDHSHGDASSQIIETAGHGVGRLRRVLEAQGYATAKLLLATTGAVPGDCTLVLDANPRTTFLPAESAALRTYLAAGGSALFMLDLGFVPEAGPCPAALRPRRPARTGGGHRSAEPLPTRCRDGGGDGLRPAPDHPHPVADLLPRHPAADVDAAGVRRGGDADPPEQPRQLRAAGAACGCTHGRRFVRPARPRLRPRWLTCGRACWGSRPRAPWRRAHRRFEPW